MMIKNILFSNICSHDLIVYLQLETTWILINIAFSSTDDLAILLKPEYCLIQLLNIMLQESSSIQILDHIYQFFNNVVLSLDQFANVV